MVSTSSALKFAKFSAIVALCGWASPAAAQSAGAGNGGAPSAGAGGVATGGGGAATSGAGGEVATGGMSGGGAGGEVTGGMSGGGAGGEVATAGMGGDMATAGTTASGGAGGSGEIPSNLLSNGTFESGSSSPWWGHASMDNADFPADQMVAITDGRACVTMTAGGKNVWDVILGYSGISLTKDQYYHISFSASADTDRTIKFKTGLGDAPYTDYFIKPIPIGVNPQTIDYTYLNLRTDATAQFQFQIGTKPGVVCFDNVLVEPVPAPVTPAYTTPAPSHHPFKDYKSFIKLGTAVDTPIFLSNPLHNSIVAGEFAMITPANSMKMNLIQPVQGTFDFTDTDALFAWAQANGLEFRGHPLVWHTQAPGWLTSGTFDRQQMIDIMYAHIDTLMAHYVGKFPYWDVVNEAIENVNGVWTYRSTFWHDRIGDDFIDLAFTRARAADPAAKLLYNDYNIEQMGNPKADRVFELVKDMKMRNIPIDAIGLQGHYFIEPNGDTTTGLPNIQAIRDNMARYDAIGVEVHITESDFRIGKPLDANKTAIQNKFYADMLQACIDAPNCSHFTVWGLSDIDSWVPSTFTDYDFAHVWDRQLMAKPAYYAMSQVFEQYNTDGSLINAGTAGAAGAGGSSSGPAPAAAKSDDGGCSVAARPSGTAPWMLTAFAALGVLLSRRRAKRAA